MHVLDSGDIMQAGWGRGEEMFSVGIDGGKIITLILV